MGAAVGTGVAAGVGAGVGAGLAVAVARVRRLLAAPRHLGGPAGETAPPAEAAPAADDLAAIRGIGPIYRSRLAEAGITSFGSLAAADPAEVAGATGVPEGRAADWIAQAGTLASR